MAFFSFSDSEWVIAKKPEAFFAQIDPVDGILALGDHVVLQERPLPMYVNTHLLCLTSEQWDDGLRICYLRDGQANLYRLNGTSPPIHEINAKLPIALNEDNVFYYHSFFCFFVRGEEGPFYIIHDLDDPLLPPSFKQDSQEEDSVAASMKRLFQKPRKFGQNSKGHWQISAMVNYANNIFLADFLLHASGMVEMPNDEPLLADLPEKVSVPLVASAQST